jgi:ACS family hexuronate transporter-like MFS transporter
MPSQDSEPLASSANKAFVGRMSHQRWAMCALLFFATVIAYVDRAVIANLKNTLENVIPGLNDFKYGIITVAFQLAYGIAMMVAGGLTDKLGTRKAFAIAITMWSIAAMLPGAAFSVASFALAMFLLGLGEAANFPACIKTVAEWFPKRERAYATGIFNSGANVGNMVAPVVVTAFVALFSQWSIFGPAKAWRGTFLVAGCLGFVWLAFWLILYRRPEEHTRVSKAELALILSDPGEKIESVPWSRVAPCKEAWAFAAAKFLTDPIWWFYLFWIPPYLQTTFHLTLSQSQIPVMLAYGISIIGSVGGGWISGALINRGLTPNKARKSTMLLCVLCIAPIFAAPFIHHLWVVVALLGLATAGHQGWSATVFTLPSDMFPKAAVASVTGIGGMTGAFGGVLLLFSAGAIVQKTHSFVTLFIIACLAYPLAFLVIHAISPKLAPAQID